MRSRTAVFAPTCTVPECSSLAPSTRNFRGVWPRAQSHFQPAGCTGACKRGHDKRRARICSYRPDCSTTPQYIRQLPFPASPAPPDIGNRRFFAYLFSPMDPCCQHQELELAHSKISLNIRNHLVMLRANALSQHPKY